MDVAELPSHFMEAFACDARVLQSFARNSSSGEPMPQRMAAGLEASRKHDLALELHQQVSVAMQTEHEAHLCCTPVACHRRAVQQRSSTAGPHAL